MTSWPLAAPFRYPFGKGLLREPLPPQEAARIEKVLGSARVFLALIVVGGIWFDPTLPDNVEPAARQLAAVYLVHAIVAFLLLRIRSSPSNAFVRTVHAVDIFWAGFATMPAAGPSNAFLIIFSFSLIAAAYRWGFFETVITALAADALIGLQVVLFLNGPPLPSLAVPVDPPRLAMRVTFLFVIGLLLGYLGEVEKHLRAETTLIARLMLRLQSEHSVNTALGTVASELMRIFHSSRMALAIDDLNTGRALLWEAKADPATGQVMPRSSEIAPERKAAYFFPVPSDAWQAVRPNKDDDASIVISTLDGGDSVVVDHEHEIPPEFLKAQPFANLMSVAVRAGDEWNSRLFVFDPGIGLSRGDGLRLLQNVVRQLGPAVYGIYLLRRLRSRAGAMERARVARELHDGAIQSIVGIEMRLDVLRRNKDLPPSVTAELTELQALVREETLNLRELMQQMRPAELDPRELLDYLADLVDRFGRDTGISAHFVSDLREVTLTPHACREMVRIVQEGLVNVRKHSAAHNVLVTLHRKEGGGVRLAVDDDGQGFEFAGRLTQRDLDARRKGPMVIKERVRAMGGQVTIESYPGRGARMEISLPSDVIS